MQLKQYAMLEISIHMKLVLFVGKLQFCSTKCQNRSLLQNTVDVSGQWYHVIFRQLNVIDSKNPVFWETCILLRPNYFWSPKKATRTLDIGFNEPSPDLLGPLVRYNHP